MIRRIAFAYLHKKALQTDSILRQLDSAETTEQLREAIASALADPSWVDNGSKWLNACLGNPRILWLLEIEHTDLCHTVIEELAESSNLKESGHYLIKTIVGLPDSRDLLISLIDIWDPNSYWIWNELAAFNLIKSETLFAKMHSEDYFIIEFLDSHEELKREYPHYYEVLTKVIDSIFKEHTNIQTPEDFERAYKRYLSNGEMPRDAGSVFLELGLLEKQLKTKDEVADHFNLPNLKDKHTWVAGMESLTGLIHQIKRSNSPLTKESLAGLWQVPTFLHKQLELLIDRTSKKELTVETLTRYLSELKKRGEEWGLGYGTFHTRTKQNITTNGDLLKSKYSAQLVITLDQLPPSIKLTQDENAVLSRIREINAKNYPTHPKGYAWSRVHMGDDKTWMIDEIQSDITHGSWPSLAYLASQKNDYNIKSEFPLAGENFAEFKKTVAQLQNKLQNIYKVMYSTVLEQARLHGISEVHIHTAESKMDLSDGRSVEKFQKVYESVPDEAFARQDDFSGYATRSRKANRGRR